MMVPHDRSTQINGLRFHFLDWGTEGLPPVLLLHGSAQTAHSWDEVAADFAADHHVIAVDQRGHGDTDWAPGSSYGRDDFVADILAFLEDRHWTAPVLMGLSMGGLNAIGFAARHPARIRALVIVDIAPRVEPTGGEAIRKHLSAYQFETFDQAVERAHAFNPRRTRENIRDRLRHALRQGADGRWVYKFDPGIARAFEHGLDAMWADVRRIHCPALLVRGAESPILAADTAEQFCRTLAGTQLTEVPGAGHSVMGDNPTGFVAAVRPFLARHRG